MRHTVKLHGVIVGHSDLEHTDRGTGRAWGPLRPGLGFELVQPVFRLFAQAVDADGTTRDDATLARYYKARDALGLSLVDAEGTAIETTVIHIVDRTVEKGPTAVMLDVLIPDEAYWQRRAADR